MRAYKKHIFIQIVWLHYIYVLSIHSWQYFEKQGRKRLILRKEVCMWKPVYLVLFWSIAWFGPQYNEWPSEIADNGQNWNYTQHRWGIYLTVDHNYLQINSVWIPSPACSGLAYFPYPQLTRPCGCSLRKEVTRCDERFSLVTSIQLATVGAHLGPTHAEYQKVPRSAKIKSLDRIPSSPRARRQGWAPSLLLISLVHGTQMRLRAGPVEETRRYKKKRQVKATAEKLWIFLQIRLKQLSQLPEHLIEQLPVVLMQEAWCQRTWVTAFICLVPHNPDIIIIFF